MSSAAGSLVAAQRWRTEVDERHAEARALSLGCDDYSPHGVFPAGRPCECNNQRHGPKCVYTLPVAKKADDAAARDSNLDHKNSMWRHGTTGSGVGRSVSSRRCFLCRAPAEQRRIDAALGCNKRVIGLVDASRVAGKVCAGQVSKTASPRHLTSDFPGVSPETRRVEQTQE